MNDRFQQFIEIFLKKINAALPGFPAQKLMAPPGRKQFEKYFFEKTTRKSAVLVLFFPGETGEINTILIKRPEAEIGSHAGQISFPGGGFITEDKSLFHTALRETHEEIGVNRAEVVFLGGLTPVYIPVSNYMVYPFAGSIHKKPTFSLNAAEAEEIIEVQVKEILNAENISKTEVFVKRMGKTMAVPCYKINGKIIWGATAMIISELAEIIKRIKLPEAL
jgi:8-oxo-dGTP pyrophosphatase MutT (NUDIX family)